jgi:hypothetical protein
VEFKKKGLSHLLETRYNIKLKIYGLVTKKKPKKKKHTKRKGEMGENLLPSNTLLNKSGKASLQNYSLQT